MEQGILTEALLSVGCACNVSQSRCFLDGADTCIYEVTSAFADKRWSG
jgi:predicted hydrocarbon binding protein